MRYLAALALALATSACLPGGSGVTGYEVVQETRTATTGAFTVVSAKTCSTRPAVLVAISASPLPPVASNVSV